GGSLPGAPTSLVATAGDGEVTLSWTAPANPGTSAITDYVIEYSTDGGVTWTPYADGVSTTTGATVTGLQNNRRYTFRVAAVNDAGAGSFSVPSDGVIPTAPVPEPVTNDLPDLDPGE